MIRTLAIPMFTCAVLILTNCYTAKAQDSTVRNSATMVKPPVTIIDPSLQGQYKDMLMKSRTQQGYKVINPNRLNMLWKNTLDTLKMERRKRLVAEQKLTTSNTAISSMKDSLSKNQENLNQTQSLANSVSVLGVPVDKSIYNSVIWGIFIVLTLSLAIVLFQTGRYKREASYRIKLFEELSEEFQTYKIKTNDREKKLARELQDYRNKLDELEKGG